MNQSISENYMGVAYITPKKQYTTLADDGRKFFLADNIYYDSCRKTTYHTNCENTELIHEIVTTTSCECLMLICSYALQWKFYINVILK